MKKKETVHDRIVKMYLDGVRPYEISLALRKSLVYVGVVINRAGIAKGLSTKGLTFVKRGREYKKRKSSYKKLTAEHYIQEYILKQGVSIDEARFLTVDQILEFNGIGVKRATIIYDFLHQ